MNSQFSFFMQQIPMENGGRDWLIYNVIPESNIPVAAVRGLYDRSTTFKLHCFFPICHGLAEALL